MGKRAHRSGTAALLVAAIWLLLAAAPGVAHAQEPQEAPVETATPTPPPQEAPAGGFDFGGWARELLEQLPPGISEG
ncbi:MAG: hypothetical protein ACRDI2_25550, partial [Chloroflexota bacterium]